MNLQELKEKAKKCHRKEKDLYNMYLSAQSETENVHAEILIKTWGFNIGEECFFDGKDFLITGIRKGIWYEGKTKIKNGTWGVQTKIVYNEKLLVKKEQGK